MAVPAPRACPRHAGALVGALVGALLLAAAFALPAAAGESVAAPAETTTAAETLMFETDHLAGIAPPVKLEYRFSWDGKEPFADRIVLAVTPAEGRTVEPDYLSGGHHVNFPPIPGAHGNPLLLYFLEHDLREMQRETHGQADYFRRLIRRAMARPDLAIEPVEVRVSGRTVKASRIVLAPFRADPAAPSRYPRLLDKTYEFVFSTDVPGQIVSLASRVASAEGPAQTVRVEWLRASPM